MSKLRIKTPRWCLPLLEHKRYKGAAGGRGSGKSHFFAELLVEEHVACPDQQSVCIREIQKSLKFSAKKLIEDKIRALGVQHLFVITQSEIRRVGGEGIIIFQGMQDHTADSIKSLEGFDRAWVEEAQSLSSRSMELLLPTIRATGSEIWFSWNPDQEDDPVEELFAYHDSDDDVAFVHVNFNENPFCPEELIKEAEKHRIRKPDTYDHVWLGGYNVISDKYILKHKYVEREFEVNGSYGAPLNGLDFGFANDPTAAVQCYLKDETLYIRRDCSKIHLELDDTTDFVKKHIPAIERRTIRADCARPESISYLQRHGLPQIIGPAKLKIEDGIEYIKSLKGVVIHPDCKATIVEFKKYQYKVDKQTGDVLPVILDKYNHCIDAIRYALHPLIKDSSAESFPVMGMF
jgi:phage terminase large subunit